MPHSCCMQQQPDTTLQHCKTQCIHVLKPENSSLFMIDEGSCLRHVRRYNISERLRIDGKCVFILSLKIGDDPLPRFHVPVFIKLTPFPAPTPNTTHLEHRVPLFYPSPPPQYGGVGKSFPRCATRHARANHQNPDQNPTMLHV